LEVKTPLCLIKHHAVKTYEGVQVQVHAFLTSELDESQLHAPIALPPGERARGNHWLGGWVGPRAGLYAMEK
jgi:hypothetical protein